MVFTVLYISYWLNWDSKVDDGVNTTNIKPKSELCPVGYEKVGVKRLKKTKATPDDCATQCLEDPNCKTFALTHAKVKEKNPARTTCILTSFQDPNDLFDRPHDRTSIYCLKKPSM